MLRKMPCYWKLVWIFFGIQFHASQSNPWSMIINWSKFFCFSTFLNYFFPYRTRSWRRLFFIKKKHFKITKWLGFLQVPKLACILLWRQQFGLKARLLRWNSNSKYFSHELTFHTIWYRTVWNFYYLFILMLYNLYFIKNFKHYLLIVILCFQFALWW